MFDSSFQANDPKMDRKITDPLLNATCFSRSETTYPSDVGFSFFLLFPSFFSFFFLPEEGGWGWVGLMVCSHYYTQVSGTDKIEVQSEIA